MSPETAPRSPLATPVLRTFVALTLSLLAACQKSDPAPATVAAASASSLPEARAVAFVKLEEVTEWNGKPWATMAEFNLIDSTGAAIDRSRWTVASDSAGVSDSPRNAIDGDPKTLWHSRWEGSDPAPPPPHWLVVGLGVPAKVSGFRYLPRQDGNTNGAIAQYRFYVSDDGVTWGQPVSSGDFAVMGEATSEKLVIFARQTENHSPVVTAVSSQSSPMGQPVSLQVKASDVDGDRLAYSAAGLPTGLAMASTTGLITGTPISPGKYPVSVSVNDLKGPPTTLAFQWTVQAPVADGDAKLAPGEIRFVKLEELTEVNGKPWASIAEFNLIGANGTVLPRNVWIASADSSDANDRPANAIDGNPATVWHSQWLGAEPQPPHSLIIDLKQGARVTGFRYLPRQDGSPNGAIARFRFYTSVDGIDWGKPLAEGDFSSMAWRPPRRRYCSNEHDVGASPVPHRTATPSLLRRTSGSAAGRAPRHTSCN